MKQRIITALILLPIMLIMLFFANNGVWATFAGVIALLALWEYSRLMLFTGKQQIGYTLATALFMLTAYCGQWSLPPFIWAIVLAFWLLVMPAWLAFKWKLTGAGTRTLLLGWLLMIPFWYALMILRPADESVAPLLSLMCVVWLADSVAYFVGKKFGKRKLAPVLSPKKSWEGALGGLAAVWIYATIARAGGWFGFETSWLATMIAVSILTFVSIGGDLLESWFKRVVQCKDSSNLLPGHGGMFDRVDSMISLLSVAAAVCVLLLS